MSKAVVSFLLLGLLLCLGACATSSGQHQEPQDSVSDPHHKDEYEGSPLRFFQGNPNK